ncbi:MAG: hypothetical protein K0S67_7 [Nitrososphaeraceae archaeon]|jgi:hypothetical protein|nr:hypothetical protein [Nitrososphaeraceae archaeon]
MSVFTAAVELLGILGESSELAKLGNQSLIFETIENQLSELVSSGMSLERAREVVINRHQTENLPNIPIQRDHSVESQNQDFISAINRNMRENTLRQRRPQYAEPSDEKDDLEDVPLLNNPVQQVRPIRLRPRVPTRPTNNTLKKGAAAAVATGAVISQATLGSGDERLPDNTGTTIPDNTVEPTNPINPIDNPNINPINNIPIDTTNKILSTIDGDIIYNPHVRGSYKIPSYHWVEKNAQKFSEQAAFNAFANGGSLY